jgi:hypothetical protein
MYQCCQSTWNNEGLTPGMWQKCAIQFFGLYIIVGGNYVVAPNSTASQVGNCGTECYPTYPGCDC